MIVSDPVRAPAAVGENCVVTEQLPPIATLSPAVQVVEAMAKSAPLTAVDAMASAAVPELVTVVTCVAAVAPMLVAVNASDAADSVAAGVLTTTATPVPESVTVLAAGVAL